MPNIKVVWPNDPPHLKEMFKLLGLSEIAGSKHEPKVLALYRDAGHPEVDDDETAWCAAAVGAALKRAGLPNTSSLMARSYVKYGTACALNKIVPRGAIIVWPRGAPPSGHVNFCLEDDGTYLTCIGGNQGNGRGGGVTISREAKAHAIAARMPPGVKVSIPLPKPKPKTADIEDVEDNQQPEAQRPAPPPPEPKEDEGKPGFFRRIRNMVVGATSGVGGFGFLTYMTDWQVALIFFVFMFIVIASLVWMVFWLFGKNNVRDWIRKQVNR